MLAFRDSGHGRPIVWIHGFPHSSAIFEPQMTIGGVRHIRVDLPGFGASPPPAPGMAISGYAHEIVAVLDHLNIHRTIVAGISMGGYVLMELLRQAPQRIEGIILIDTRERADSDQAREDRYKTVAGIEKNGTQAVIDSMLPKMIFQESRREAFLNIMRTASAEGMVAAQRAMAGRLPSTATLRSVKMPALIVQGDHDPITSVEDARRMASLIPGSKLVIIQDAAHASNFDQPEIFNSAVTEFLAIRFGSK